MERNARFARKLELPFPLLCDTDREMGIAYGACEDRSAGSARRISYLIGPDGKIRRAYAKVKPASHPETVLKELD